MVGSGFSEFKLDFAGTKKLGIGDIVYSDDFWAGDHVWRVRCYPHGHRGAVNGDYLSIFLQLVGKSSNVKAIFDVFLMDNDGTPSLAHAKRCVKVYPPEGFEAWGFGEFVKRTDLEVDYMVDGHVTFMCGAIVLCDNPIAVPSSDIGDNLSCILDSGDGSDVTFQVSSNEFRAHRAVLAARSPDFKALLLGAMKDAKTECIKLHDVKPATFEVMLQFMYTDSLPRDEEIQSSSIIDLFQNLLAAADMYHLDRLKMLCTKKLWEHLSAETVATLIGCAEKHNCAELKNSCLDFFVVEKNFKNAVLNKDYAQLMQSFPSVIDEIRARVQK